MYHDSHQSRDNLPPPEVGTSPGTEDDKKGPEEWIDDFCPLSLDDYLDSDPVDNHGDASFTGVWTAAKGLMDYLRRQQQQPKTILELGAGTGWLGITIGRNLSSIRHMVLTDSNHTGAVQWTRRNVAAALQQGLPGMERIETVALDWNDNDCQQVTSLHEFDWILGSDLIYSEDRVRPLAKTIAILLAKQPQARFLYGHTQGRMSEVDLLWEQELKAHGLMWEVQATVPQWGDQRTVIMEIGRTKC